MNLTPEERQIGRDNYYQVLSDHDHYTRRGFLKGVVALGGVSAAGIGAVYFGYQKPNNPVRIGIIGTGDEGNVLIGALNPEYVQVKAIAEIRPSSVHRAFYGDWATSNTIKVRPGLMSVYGYKSHDQARKNIKVTQDYRELLKDPDIEGVIIALPLHLHAQVAVDAMKAGKHVLTEKLMAKNIAQCKIMGRLSEEKKTYLATGHQRHYSILYDNAVNLIKWGVLGQIHFIRAQWHRGNLPGADSWALPLPGGESVRGSNMRIDEIADELKKFQQEYASADPTSKDLLKKKIEQWMQMDQDKTVDASKYGYIDDPTILGDGRMRTALEELIRWRLWDRTGGGLMAELGSHQLDAASIFISAMGKEKLHPLTVHAVGGRHIFPNSRDADDHVYCTFEFPAPAYREEFKPGYHDAINNYPDPKTGIPGHQTDPEKKVVVTYSSINGNGFGGYGEIVMGTKGTLVLETEKEVMVYKTSNSASVGAKESKKDGPTLDTTASGDGAIAKAAETGDVSRGYAEEIEHWAWCIRSGDWDNQPRCKPEVAVADAVIALTARLAIQNGHKPGGHGFIQFKDEWFDINNDSVPEVADNATDGATIANMKKELGG